MVNDTEKEVPYLLSAITVGQYIDYYKQFGRDLEIESQKISQAVYNNDEERDDANHEHMVNKALSWYTYWTGMDFFSARDESFFIPAYQQYLTLIPLLEDKDELYTGFLIDIEFNNEIWQFQDFKSCSYEEMNYKQIKITKEVVLHLEYIKMHRWQHMPWLLTVFFRKKNEPFTEDLTEERAELMKLVPMNIAMSLYKMLNHVLDVDEVPELKEQISVN